MKTQTKDILIQDKGNNVASVIPQTEEAKNVFKQQKHLTIKERKSGFDIVSTEAIKILTWAVTHNLSVDSQVPMKVLPKGK